VSERQRKRTVCAACGNSCRTTPTELQMRHEHVAGNYWLWAAVALCPPCRTAQRDLMGRAAARLAG
jgi:hypothetical protein